MDWQREASILKLVLDLGREVVAVDTAQTEEEFEQLSAPMLKHGLSFCAMVRLASIGRGRKARGPHFRCPGSADVFRFVTPDPDTVTKRLYTMGLYADMAVAARAQDSMARLAEPCAGVAVTPLTECDRPPRSVLIFANAYQTMRLVQGWAYHHGPVDALSVIGNRGVCAEGVARPLATGSLHVSPLCSNTRYAARWSDNEQAVGVPYAGVPSLIDGLVRTIPAVEPPDRVLAIRQRCEQAGLALDIPAGVCYYLRR